MSKMIYVKFKERIIELPEGVRAAKLSDISPSFPLVLQTFQRLQTNFAAYDLHKAIPSAVWGDVVREHRRTGELVSIKDMSQLFILRFSGYVSIDDVIFELEQLPEVEYAHGPIQAVSAVSPNDPNYVAGDQWNLAKIEAPKAWDVTTGNSEVVVGIIDLEGVKRAHLDFSNSDGSSQFIQGKGDATFGSNHGTQVAGVVAAATDNNEGIASLGWNIKMIPYHWTGTGSSDIANLPAKIDTAVNRDSVDILNLSFVTTAKCLEDTNCFVSANYGAVSDEIENALTQGVIVVAAAGNKSLNDGTACQGDPICDLFPYTPYPANYAFQSGEVIGVSATDSNDTFVTGFNHGSFVDIAAPGKNILSTGVTQNYFPDTGTSFSAPHVAALAGLILSIDPGLTIQQVQQVIENTAIDIGEPASKQGAGRINAYEALKEAIPTKINSDITSSITYNSFVLVENPDTSTTKTYYVDGNGQNVTLTIGAGAVFVVEKRVRLIATDGDTITIDPNARVCLEPAAEIIADDNSYVNDNGGNICFHGTGSCLATTGGTLKFASGLTRTVDNGGFIAGFASGGTIEIADNATLVFEDGAQFIVQEGTTLKMGSNVDIVVNSDAVANVKGKANNQITFTSLDGTANRSDWGTIFVYSASDTFEYTIIEGSDWGIKFVGPSSDNVVRNCTFRDNTRAIHAEYTELEISDCTIENNYHALYLVNNTSQYGGIYLDDCTIRNNDRDGIYSVNSLVDVFNTTLDNNGLGNATTYHGIWADNNSDIVLGSRNFSSNSGGYNTVKNNHGAGVYRSSNSYVLLGYYVKPGTEQAGYNSIYGNGTFSGNYSGKDVYNNHVATTYAHKIYWGSASGPSSGQFFGPVDSNYWLSSPPFPGGGGAMVMAPPSVTTTMALKFATNINSTTVSMGSIDEDMAMKQQLIAEWKALIAQKPESEQAIETLQGIYSFVRTDWQNKLAERSKIFAYLNSLYASHRNLPLGQTAFQLMVVDRLSKGAFSDAIALAESIPSGFSSATKRDNMVMLVLLYLRTGQVQNAQNLFNAFKSAYPADDIHKELLQNMFSHVAYDSAFAKDLSSQVQKSKLASATTFKTAEPSKFVLQQNYPNPFNPETRIQYQIPERSFVRLKIFNLRGQEVKTLEETDKSAGLYSIVWDGRDKHGRHVSSGIYVYQITVEPVSRNGKRFVDSRKLVLVR